MNNSLVTQMTIHDVKQNPIYGEGNTTLTLTDEAAGGFFIIGQGDSEVRLDLGELGVIYNSAQKMLREYEKRCDENNT